MKLDNMPSNLREALRERGFTDDQMQVLSGYGAFKEFCEWNGLRGWAPWLWELSDWCRKNE